MAKKESGKLSRNIIIFILINAILGSSLFYLPSLGMISAGPASLIAWAVIFVIAYLVMLYYAELITLFPSSGGTYNFVKQSYGRFIAFMAGWLIWLAGNLGMALNVVAAAEYSFPSTAQTTFIIRGVFVLAFIFIFNYIALRGIDAGAKILVGFGVASLTFVALIVIPTFIDIPALFQGTFSVPFNVQQMQPFYINAGLLPILGQLGLALFLITEAFFGFDILAYMGGDIKDKKSIPKAMKIALGFSAVIMLLFVLSSMGIIHFEDYITTSRPYVDHVLITLGAWAKPLAILFMNLAILGTAAGWPIVGSRLIQALSADGLFIKKYAELHPKTKMPTRAIWWQTIITVLFAAVIFWGYMANWKNPYKIVYLIYVLSSLIVLSLVLFAVPRLRKKVKTKRIFKAPLANIGPPLIVVFFGVLIWNWIAQEGTSAIGTIRLTSTFIVIGIPLYFLIEMYYNSKSIRGASNTFAWASVLTERIFFPRGVDKRVLSLLGSIQSKKVLEFGCYLGALTKKLGKAVSSRGKVHSVCFTKSNTKIATRRTRKHKQVTVKHHPHFHDVKIKVQKADVLVSTGALATMKNHDKVLSKLSKLVKKGGKVVFVDFEKYFFVLSNIPWFKTDKHLKKMFDKAGFKVNIHRRRGLFAQHIFVHGVRK